jgi:hypothetical protein
MPEMDNLNALAGIVDPVIDPNRRVQDGADIGSLNRDNTDVWKGAEKVHMVQKGRRRTAQQLLCYHAIYSRRFRKNRPKRAAKRLL